MRANSIERGSGVALWRQIADRIRQGIADGSLANNGKLLPETQLAAMFGANRHTVRSAISALEQEGVVYAEQGRGTFIRTTRRISYALGSRTRFSSNLEGQAKEVGTTLLKSATVTADPYTAHLLGLAVGAPVIRLEVTGYADGQPLSYAVHWFDAVRFKDIEMHYNKTKSITAALTHCGIVDYVRRSTSVTAHHADSHVLAALELTPGAIVLATKAINETPQGVAFQLSETLFPADRIELMVARDPE